MSEKLSISGVESASPAADIFQAAYAKSPRTADSVHVRSLDDLERQVRQGEDIPISEQQLIRAIERAIKAMQGANTTLEFSVHEKTKTIMVKVLNRDTGEVIREIPPEKNLDFVAKLWEMT